MTTCAHTHERSSKPLPPQHGGPAGLDSGASILAGSLLLVAAFLKASAPGDWQALQAAYGVPSWLQLFLVGGEWLLGSLLLAGVEARRTTAIALFAFLAFAAFSLYRGAIGAESCGCFGALKVSPWTMFGVDLMIAVALWRTWRRLAAQQVTERPLGPAGHWRRMLIAATCTVAGVSVVGSAVRSQPARPAADGLLGVGGLVVLEPEAWTSMPFWLGQHIQIDGDLMRGDWILLFSHQGCPKCDEAMSEYEKRAAARANPHEAPAMAVIEVSPLNNPASSSAWSGLRGFLSQDREWFVRTPFEVRLRDGVVENATYELPLLSEASFDEPPVREPPFPMLDDGV